ncbi:hypothetical protein D7M11_08285 [Paenibacillus ginsengarvi]|uniref:Uncharacterized protein n=1 Tax=Paenibacillus ginsengarvi TaxID=400777 RepID=A0A3B0CJ13_9BACL|nr:hypothetical protein D7M11_08285 [Paenibacillus ginsengarvi]
MSRNKSSSRKKKNSEKQIQLDVMDIIRYMGKDPTMAKRLISESQQTSQTKRDDMMRISGIDMPASDERKN